MNLLYITLGGNIALHSQAAFSIYSFLAQDKGRSGITILTDSPLYYSHLKHHVRVKPFTTEMAEEWKGPHDFFWRVKIKAIEWMCREYPGKPVLYLDTDTFFYGDPIRVQNILMDGNAIMHEDEGMLSEIKAKTTKKMWSQISRRSFGGLEMQKAEKMWNAGTVGTPNTKDCYECKLALQVCDDMCAASVTPRLIEQLALSVALNNVYGVIPVDAFIGHYWSNKQEWDKAIANFFLEMHFQNKCPEAIIEEIRGFNFSQLPVKKIKSNTAERLVKKINILFKPKLISYINKK